jgi:hypothetical protein
METVGVLALQKFLREVMDFDYSDTSRWKKGIKMERAGVRALKKLLGEIMTFGVSSLKKRKKRGNGHQENDKGSKRAKPCETVVPRGRIRVATDFFRPQQEERWEEKPTQRDGPTGFFRAPQEERWEEKPTQRDGPQEPTPVLEVCRTPKDVNGKRKTHLKRNLETFQTRRRPHEPRWTAISLQNVGRYYNVDCGELFDPNGQIALTP